MEKNGKTIKCKVCSNELYISRSRFGYRKYCSWGCAKKDDFGFKPRSKNCKLCGKKFVITQQLRSGDKMCSQKCRQKCRYDNQVQSSKLQREKKKTQIIKRKCRQCGKEVISNEYVVRNFCGGVSGRCYRSFMSEHRRGKANPAYRNGFAVQGSRKYTGIHLRVCSKYRKAFLKKYSYPFCEICRVNQMGTLKFEVHHIYFASQYPKHPQLHNFLNLIYLCIQCHNDMHAGKKNQDIFKRLEKERGLKKLFATKREMGYSTSLINAP